MTELGIPVFNTPGANANAVKELVLCGMLLGSRRIIDGINHMSDLGQQGVAKDRVEKDKAMFGGQEIAGKTLAVIGLGHIGSMTARDAKGLGMLLKGYDPGLSIQSALKLPRKMELTDSIVAAVAGADYVSLNIPYIKGDGGTHGVIGKEVLDHMKPGAVVLNFARGELVDSEAMKEFLDASDGRYITDFPDDLLWDHKNAVVLPHLGASTEEAEDSAVRSSFFVSFLIGSVRLQYKNDSTVTNPTATTKLFFPKKLSFATQAAMAADTIRDFLETGTIRNSVNFPATALPDKPENSVRFTVVNKNEPGMLAHITEAFAEAKLNILQQINHSKDNIAYNVMDVGTTGSAGDVLSFKHVQEKITMLDGVLSSRVLYGAPGTGYARNLDGEYFV